MVLPYVVAFVVSGTLWGLLWRHRDRRAAKGFLLDVSGVVLLSAVVALKVSATDFGTKLFWWNWRFLGVSAMAVGYMLMAVEYTDNEDLVDWRVGGLLSVVVVLTQAAAWTNGRDGLLYSVTGLDGGLLVPSFGPLYWVYATVMVGCIVVGVALLVRVFHDRVGFRVQTSVLVGTIALVMGGVVLWWFRVVPLDTLAVTSTVKVVGFYVAVERLQLLETLPVARTTVFRTMEDAVFVLNDDGRVVDANPSAVALVGGRSVTGAFLDDVLDVAATADRDDTGGGDPGTAASDGGGATTDVGERDDAAAVDGGRAAGASVLGSDEVTLVVDDEERYFDVERSRFQEGVGAVAVFRDITERRKREREITVLNRIVRHDIRNEMNVLHGHAQLLEPHLDDAATADYELVMESATHVVDITDTVRELMETITSGGSMDGEPLSLPAVLDAEVAKARSNFPAATFHVADVPSVLVHGNDLLSSVFTNLLNNAVVHNDGDDPEVWVSVDVDGDVVRVTVAEDGPGVPPDQRDAVFGRGAKGLASEGTGVGLYLVDTLVSAVDGDVRIRDAPQGGAAFVVTLQVVGGTEAGAGDAVSDDSAGGSGSGDG
nr:histidine kinase N-terminal 7TM domain-containing protein [Halorubellus salinus]